MPLKVTKKFIHSISWQKCLMLIRLLPKGLSLLARKIFIQETELGMFVAPQAKERIRQKRINENLQQLVFEVVAEAKRLQVPPRS